jgi:hypothetical protein
MRQAGAAAAFWEGKVRPTRGPTNQAKVKNRIKALLEFIIFK